jgi:guanylate kinase
MISEAPCLVIAGPSGVGKTTLIKAALSRNQCWEFSVSATTRLQREGEENGKEYYFISRGQFDSDVQAGQFLEYAEVYGHSYGTPVSELTKASEQGKCLLIEVDTVGCLSIRALRPEIPLVAVLPPSMDVLKQRLRDRGTEDEASLNRRYANIIAELGRMRGFDYAIINDDLEQATDQLLSLMNVLEKNLHRVTVQVDKLLK